MTQMHVHAFRNSVNPVSTIARLRRLAGPAHHGLLLAAVMLMTAGTAKASGSSMPTPIWISALAISAVSLLFSAPVSRLVPFASAASSSARLVIDFEPGGVTRPTNG